MRHEINRIQSRDHNVESYRINKNLCLLTMIKNIYILEDGYSRLSNFLKSTC